MPRFRQRNWLALLAAVPGVVLAVQVYFTCGIVYSLDDPYIHLALARQILHGNYGINPGEFAAPASSILWPFLLAPFAFTSLSEFVPLVLNLGALAIAVWWIDRWLGDWLSPGWALLATVAAAFALNFYGLVLTGMEHSLQVTLVVIVGLSLVQDRIAWPFWLSVVLLPLVRYEGLAISLPALAWLAFLPEHRSKVFAAAAIIAVTVGGFSLFLHAAGLGWLPSSVLVKNDPAFSVRLHEIPDNIKKQFFFVAIALFAGWLYWREGRVREGLLLVATPTLLHLVFGRYGYFGRYNVYWLVWILILFWPVYARSRLVRLVPINLILVAGLAWGVRPEVMATLTTASGSRNIHDQQKQMGVVARDFLDEPVAVNDLGFVSFYARRYVLDLSGIGSYEAFKLDAASTSDEWIAGLMERRKVEHAMIYDVRFEHRPANWIRVATLYLPPPWITVGDDQVTFYSTGPAAAARLRRALGEYRKSSTQAALMLVLAPQ
ncbi:MAG: hypothetical protein ACHQK9_11555 [Reyranellales bacterium]